MSLNPLPRALACRHRDQAFHPYFTEWMASKSIHRKFFSKKSNERKIRTYRNRVGFISFQRQRRLPRVFFHNDYKLPASPLGDGMNRHPDTGGDRFRKRCFLPEKKGYLANECFHMEVIK